ncbi:MAG: DNA mismatch repair protein MutS [Saprospiraceae bacterium]
MELETIKAKPKDSFNFAVIQEYFSLNDMETTEYTLSDRSVEDLDFHDFFASIDRTTSAVGQQYLYDRLRRLETSEAKAAALESELNFYTQDEKRTVALQKILSQLSTSNDYYFPFLIFGDLPPRLNFFSVIRVLQMITFLSIFASIFYPSFLLLLILIFGINLFLHYWHKMRIGNFAAIFARLVRLTKTAKQLLVYTQPEKGIDATLTKQIHQVEKLTGKVLLLKTENLQGNEITSLIWYIFELFKIITLTEISTFHTVVDDIQVARPAIKSLFDFIGKIDLRLSINRLRTELPFYSQPIFTAAQKEMELVGIYHPLVKNCVENDLHLVNKSLLLTGSNMSGKTTFIRTVNLNLIAAQTMNTSFSKKYRAPILAIASSIRITDDLQEDKSYYMEEVAAIGHLIDCAEQAPQFLFTIDEVFKGTNTIERISAAKAILAYLTQKNNIVFVSTHDIELTELLSDTYELHYFQESIADEKLSFDYKIKQGALKQKNAIRILEIAGYPKEILAEARRLTVKFEAEKTGRL